MKLYYDKNCEITYENVKDDFFDLYSASHFFGWFFISMITRNFWLLIVWQLQDEIIERSYSYIYPVFNECWWDSVILDVIVCNTTGIILGYNLMKLLKREMYDFFGAYDGERKRKPFS